MVNRVSLNDDQLRETMVGDNAAEYGDRKDQAVFFQASLYQGRNDQAKTRDIST